MIVAVDYGDSWCGVATSEGEIPEPYGVVKTKNVVSELKKLNPKVVVVGVSEGKSAEKARKFAKSLEDMLLWKVETVDETLTTVEAQNLSKDKKDQHAIAAALILERYLENHV